MKKWRIPITLALVALLLMFASMFSSAQGAVTLTFSEEDWFTSGEASIDNGILTTTHSTGLASYSVLECTGAMDVCTV